MTEPKGQDPYGQAASLILDAVYATLRAPSPDRSQTERALQDILRYYFRPKGAVRRRIDAFEKLIQSEASGSLIKKAGPQA